LTLSKKTASKDSLNRVFSSSSSRRGQDDIPRQQQHIKLSESSDTEDILLPNTEVINSFQAF